MYLKCLGQYPAHSKSYLSIDDWCVLITFVVSMNLMITSCWDLSHISCHSKSFLWAFYSWICMYQKTPLPEGMLYMSPQFNMAKKELNILFLSLPIFLPIFFESRYCTINHINTQTRNMWIIFDHFDFILSSNALNVIS